MTADPQLVDLLIPYYLCPQLEVLDVQLVLDGLLLEQLEAGNDLTALLRRLETLPRRASEDDALRLLPTSLHDLAPPDGPGDHLPVLRAVRDRVREAVNGALGGSPPLPGDGFVLPRASKFASEALANEACTLLVRRHYDLLKRLEAATLGWGAVHLYGDLSAETGTLGTVIVNTRPAGSSLAVEPGATYQTSCAVMVMRRDPASGNPYVYTAYPELPLATAALDDFPALCHLFGAWFGQDHEQPAVAMRQGFSGMATSARAELTDDLDRLLGRPDDAELRLVLEACGSYVLPDAVRAWLAATRHRIDAFDWS